MRASMLALAAAAALFVGPVPAFSQGIQFEVGPGGVRVNPGRRGDSRQCEELRLACENRDRLGERGEGNCRRYRETCLRPVQQVDCRELRRACLFREELGERGAGNCRRYRELCRGEEDDRPRGGRF